MNQRMAYSCVKTTHAMPVQSLDAQYVTHICLEGKSKIPMHILKNLLSPQICFATIYVLHNNSCCQQKFNTDIPVITYC